MTVTAVTVLGVGNVILGDDAFGPQVVRRLQAFYRFDPGVALVDTTATRLEVSPGRTR
ncbi:MAG: hypothetical protein GWN99_02650 [Gemmatimonadetes bacterium]|uniref:Hydrogenase maturation protease n=1 Tax=Candidatus Kutchimonas denitrificans TaxID=3056748 RepID=A0AAE4Z6V9_9BACT|nr:hypothetical protein [Gemmatimonadota bacterium]NIR74855.1 hypothetical protein [Candidatus Kutchimonas denitrificans]NIR99966.1 hypothetical protein [Gemmatimonadota bacterium]NIT65550.1 hypothetical protein [Gemmatimonadota bacterium]NIU52520.1 hypothetical protein [Gemmatimonadota bacterium]